MGKCSQLMQLTLCFGGVLKLLHAGGLGQALQEHPMLFQRTTIIRKIVFPDDMTGDVRND